MIIAFLRHGPTLWNQKKWLQGHANIPLTDEARAWFAARRLPGASWPARCLSSPLSRAVESALLLSPVNVEIDPLLIETNWGGWEGNSLAKLRDADPAGMARDEARGLDLTPPDGESPRDVCKRLSGFFTELVKEPDNGLIFAVSHKGIIRAAMSLATGWDFQGRPPIKFDWQCLHLFELGTEGQLKLSTPNVPLEVLP